MHKILRIHASPRGAESESYRLSQGIVEHLLRRHPGASLVERPLSAGTISHVDTHYANALGGMADGEPAAASMLESERLIQELEQTHSLVISTPMHNYTVPSALKAWIDHVLRVHRSFRPTPQGKVGTLDDRPTYVAVSSGGNFSSEPARQPDFLTPYLTAVLNTMGIRDIHYFTVEGTARGPQARELARNAALECVAERFLEVSA
ncbi:FMN-dependent NADH-azoreductase [Bordetella petrii]|uniref:FMN-dependent NADH-azoreductase n=1 Tax=Bordetella petrii TaxID=94624 RepID=UPI001E5F41B2|nr:NAD(P)H-dependent oxidoreductase [Bordetella petrii]MCD0502861.1 NAD(P)H-dependent oxidoreductase [Bordetella petrii]